jgi:hypothetical protein
MPSEYFAKLLNITVVYRRPINYSATRVVNRMVTDTARAYTGRQPIAVATERAEQVGRRKSDSKTGGRQNEAIRFPLYGCRFNDHRLFADGRTRMLLIR